MARSYCKDEFMILNNEYLFGYATTMEERIHVLSISSENHSLTHLKKWKNRKSLLSDSDFERMLSLRNISEVEYDLAVSPLNESSLRQLFSFVQKQEWYNIHKKIFSITRTCTPASIEAALYFHVKFYMDFISGLSTKYKEIAFDDSCLTAIEKNITTQLMNLARKTIVWDVHAKLENTYKERQTDKESLKYYLHQRFRDNCAEYFFLEYPTLTRLLAERIMNQMNNLQIIIDSLHHYHSEITSLFGITLPFTLNTIQFQKGDSHNKGKTATILKINHVPLVYKFRSNQILHNYNELLTFLEKKHADFHPYKIVHLSGKDFCIEEFIENESCTDENSIIEYYKNYGHLAALTYWLGSSDLHSENLIAKGTYPVLIDVETLLSAQEQRIYSDDFTKIKYFESHSAVSTGMLPMEKYWKKQIDFSALNGIRQKLPYKVRKLLHEDSSKIAFALCDAYSQPADNVPKLNGKRVTYEHYCGYIQKSFEEMLVWLKHHENDIDHFIQNKFYGTKVRIVLRDTQDYYNFLDFSTHPSCMVDYIEREKIFENLWNHSFVDSNIVLQEVQALYRHDIPYFYTFTHSRDIFSLDGSIADYFSHDIMATLRKHHAFINPYNIDYSTFLLGESLDCLSSACRPVSVRSRKASGSPWIDKANDIASKILDTVIVNTKENAVLWPEPCNHGEKLLIDYPDANLYHGTAGLFVFFYHLNKLSPDSNYKQILQILEHEVFAASHASELESAFYGTSCKITAAFAAYHFDKDKKFYDYITQYLSEAKAYASHIKSWDWIRGKSGLIALLVTIYEECPLPMINDLLKILLSDIEDMNVSEIGFAHGCSGILYALLRANTILSDANIDHKILELYQKTETHLQTDQQYSPAWCNGTMGINKALSEFLKQHPDSHVNFIRPARGYTQNNSCICHGTFSGISSACDLLRAGQISDQIFRKKAEEFARKEIVLCGYKRFVPLGLFSGLAGIGYQLIRCICPYNTLDLLFFDSNSNSC